jgi:hypothetical protein
MKPLKSQIQSLSGRTRSVREQTALRRIYKAARGIMTRSATALTGPSPMILQWRCRESNPGPSLLCQGFSERSSLCLYSALRIM